MAIAAFADYHMLGYARSLDFGNRMARETVTSAISHLLRIRTVAFNTGLHRIVARIGIDCFEECGMTGHAIPRAPPKRQ